MAATFLAGFFGALIEFLDSGAESGGSGPASTSSLTGVELGMTGCVEWLGKFNYGLFEASFGGTTLREWSMVKMVMLDSRKCNVNDL